ncbi:MAG TPA: hypothetical protein VLM85_21720 [Polyangiaceae bacterium]|nr:hypothetical protein [Polyangiaceae bacterium]
MNYAQPPFDPSAPFRNPAVATPIDPSGHHPKARAWFLVVAIVSGALYLIGACGVGAAMAIDDHDVSPILAVSGFGLLMLGALLIYVKLGLGLYWLHQAWKWLPMEQRFDKNGKRVGPDGVFMLLIPYYNLYWMFVINLALCDAMERVRFTARTTQTASRDTAMWACILELVPFANFFVAPFFWASYMRQVDAMHEEIFAVTAARA